MWNNIYRWYTRNSVEITWFLMGWLTVNLIDELTTGRYGMALFTAFLLWLGYRTRNL